jgi:predicted RNA binding protein YcfA (HicA-like mRNA interferase family)
VSSNPLDPARKLKRRITPVSWKRLRCVFERDGFTFRRQEGDHLIFAKAGCLRPVVIPTYDAIDVGIIKSNMRTARMSRDRYFELLEVCR